MTNAPQTRIRVAFDPFEFAPLFRWAGRIRSRTVGVIATGIVAVTIIAALIDGTFGTWSDVQPAQDIQRVVDPARNPATVPNFTFARDAASWFLLLVVIITCVIVHRQWVLMREAIPLLVTSRALTFRTHGLRPAGWRRLILPKAVRRSPNPSLSDLVGAVNDFGRKVVARGTVLLAGGSAFLAYSLVQGEHNGGLFRVIMPPGLSAQEQSTWLTTAYDSWWAGTNHAIGNIAYFLVAVFASYVILLQNVVGVTAAYIATCLPSVVDLDADWLDRDGNHGWKPVADVFRTVYFSLALHGVTLAVILIILGIENFQWVGGLVLIWVTVVPLYIAVPWFVFHRVEARARAQRLRDLDALAAQVAPHDIARFHAIAVEVQRTRKANIRPMQLRLPAFSSVILAALSPVLLAIARLIFEINFGAL